MRDMGFCGGDNKYYIYSVNLSICRDSKVHFTANSRLVYTLGWS